MTRQAKKQARDDSIKIIVQKKVRTELDPCHPSHATRCDDQRFASRRPDTDPPYRRNPPYRRTSVAQTSPHWCAQDPTEEEKIVSDFMECCSMMQLEKVRGGDARVSRLHQLFALTPAFALAISDWRTCYCTAPRAH